MKLFKKAISVLLASTMCVPAGVINIAEAAEGETSTGAYTVSLKTAAGGSMKITESSMSSSTASQEGYQLVKVGEDGNLEKNDNDGTFYAFSKGDTVEIECMPDEGYSVQKFWITNATTGKVLASKETSDNFFSFNMPGQSVNIEVTFADYSTIPIVDDKDEETKDNASDAEDNSEEQDSSDGKSEGESKDKNSDDEDQKDESDAKETGIDYQDITETSSITEKEVDEVMSDVVTESYIKANINEKYSRVTDKMRIVNWLQITNSFFDGTLVKPEDTIDSIMDVLETADPDSEEYDEQFYKFMGQTQASVLLYEFDPDSDYYVGLANTMQKDKNWHVQDIEIGPNSTDGTVFDDCIYDYDTGLIYIPKKYFWNEKEQKTVLAAVRTQLMQVYDKKDITDAESSSYTTYVDDDAIQLVSSKNSIYDLETSVNVDDDMRTKDYEVRVNGIPVDKEFYTIKHGKLTLKIPSSSVSSVEIAEKDKTVSEEIKEIFTDAAAGSYSGGYALDEIPSTVNLHLGTYHLQTGEITSENDWFPHGVADLQEFWNGKKYKSSGVKYTYDSNTQNRTPVWVIHVDPNGDYENTRYWSSEGTDKGAGPELYKLIVAEGKEDYNRPGIYNAFTFNSTDPYTEKQSVYFDFHPDLSTFNSDNEGLNHLVSLVSDELKAKGKK